MDEAITREEFDRRLDVSTAQIEAENSARAEHTRELEQLLAQKEALLMEMETAYRQFQLQKQRIDTEISRLLPAGTR